MMKWNVALFLAATLVGDTAFGQEAEDETIEVPPVEVIGGEGGDDDVEPTEEIACPPGKIVIESTCETPNVKVDYVTRYRYRGPKKLKAVEGEEPPAGYVARHTSFKGLWIAGLSIFGASYLVSLSASLPSGNEDNAYTAMIPGVGPFIAAGHADGGGLATAWSILGLVQGLGVTLFSVGVSTKRTIWLRDDVAEIDGPTIRLGPGSVSLETTF